MSMLERRKDTRDKDVDERRIKPSLNHYKNEEPRTKIHDLNIFFEDV